MKRISFFIIIFILMGLSPLRAGTTTLVTYYPSPSGSYNDMSIYRYLSFLQSWPCPSTLTPGQTALVNNNGVLSVCNNNNGQIVPMQASYWMYNIFDTSGVNGNDTNPTTYIIPFYVNGATQITPNLALGSGWTQDPGMPLGVKGNALITGNTTLGTDSSNTTTINGKVVVNSGNVGIGTPSPVAPLEVVGNTNWEPNGWKQTIVATSNSYPTLRLRALGSGTSSFIGNDNDGGLWFGVNGNDTTMGNYAMVIKPNGNVGIGGILSPSVPLDVNGKFFFGEAVPGRGVLSVNAYNNGTAVYLGVSDLQGGDNDSIYIEPNQSNNNGTVTLGANNIYLAARNGIFCNGPNIQCSDARLKKDVTTIPNALKRVCSLRGVNFHWRDKNRDQSLQMGLLAQEVEKVFPDVVKKDDKGMKSIAYDQLIGALVESIKQQQKEILELKQEVNKLKRGH
ncbi:MAG: tail fiber domain-containing protein [Candidatus Omnitrophica bacterium]|nr:tail fiber domain-containing protein [Candidatus Omnitrophota bacterium]